ncbi:MAG: hypothetical protein ACI4PG_02520, partial [Candidatus Ventricola sp.]
GRIPCPAPHAPAPGQKDKDVQQQPWMVHFLELHCTHTRKRGTAMKRRLSIMLCLFTLLTVCSAISMADQDCESENAIRSMIKKASRTDELVEIGRDVITSFFYSCARSGIFFDTTHPYDEHIGDGKLSYQVYYELQYSGKPFRLYFNVYSDGSLQFGIDTLGEYMSSEDAVFSLFASSVTGIDVETAQKVVKDYSIEAYMRGRPYSDVKDGWKYTATFSESHRMITILSE